MKGAPKAKAQAQTKCSHGAPPGLGARPLHASTRKMEKAHAFPEARSSPQACLHAGKSSSSDPLLLPLHFFVFSTGVGNCRNESSCLLQTRPKRSCLVSLRHKTTSFWSFYLFFKPIQNDVVLDLSHLSKRRRFGFKSLIQTTSFWISDLKQFQNDVVLNCHSPKRRRFSCRTLKLDIYTSRTQKLAIFFAPAPIFAQFQAKQRKYTAKHCTRAEEAENQPN